MTTHCNTKQWAKVVGCALAAFVGFAAAAQADNTVTVGNSAGRSVVYEPVSDTDTAGVALYLPDYYMQAYRGCRITQLKLQLNNTVGADSLRLFITRDLNGTPDYEQRVTPSKKSLTIDLDTPYEISGQALYIGYTVQGVKYLCYSNALVTGEEWIWKRSTGWERYAKKYTATLTATVEGDQLPQDVRLTQSTMPEHSLTNKSIPMTGQLVNLGASAVNSLTVDYTVDGNVVATETVSGLNIMPRAAGKFSLSALKIADEGQPTVSYTIAAVNGLADGVMADNTSREQSILCRDSFTKRKVLLEVFSTELCPNCPSAHETLETVLGRKTDVVEVGHHSGFYTDSLTVQASVDYEWFYPDNKLYAPALMFNRTCMQDNYATIYSDGTPVVSPTQSTITQLYEEYKDAPAYATINLSRTYDKSTRKLDVAVRGKQLLPLASPDSLRLYVMLTEDSIFTTTQRGASGNFYHRHALRQVLSATWGDPVDISDGYSASYTATLPEAWNDSHMSVVAFVACHNATDKNDCRVLNVEQLYLCDQPSAIVLPTLQQHAVITGGTLAMPDGSPFSLYSANGQQLATGVRSFDVSLLGHGVYVVKCKAGTTKLAL